MLGRAPAILLLQLVLSSVSGFAPSPHIPASVYSGFFDCAVSLSTFMCLRTADSFRRSNKKGTVNDGSCSPDYSLACVDLKSFKNNLVDIIQQNKERWKELAAQGTVVYKALPPPLSVLPPLRFWIFPSWFYSFIKYASPWWYLEFSYPLIILKKVG